MPNHKRAVVDWEMLSPSSCASLRGAGRVKAEFLFVFPVLVIVWEALLLPMSERLSSRTRRLFWANDGLFLEVFLGDGTSLLEQVSFVTVPRPQVRKLDVRVSVLVLSSWLSFPCSEVVLACRRETYDPFNQVLPVIVQVFGCSRLRFAGDLPTGYDNRPLVREWFKLGVNEVKRGYLCFLNGDIIPSYEWFYAAMRVFRALGRPSNTVVFGTRTEVRPARCFWTINASAPSYRYHLESCLRRSFSWNNPWGMDLVLFHSTFSELDWNVLPDFVVGMCVWDNFFQGWANCRCETVAMDFYPMVFHVSHPANACNRTNLRYFRVAARCSPLNAPHHYASHAVWHLNYRQQQVRNSRTGEVVPLAGSRTR